MAEIEKEHLIGIDELAERLHYKPSSLRAIIRKLGPRDGVYRHGQRHVLIDWNIYSRRLRQGKLGSDFD